MQSTPYTILFWSLFVLVCICSSVVWFDSVISFTPAVFCDVFIFSSRFSTIGANVAGRLKQSLLFPSFQPVLYLVILWIVRKRLISLTFIFCRVWLPVYLLPRSLMLDNRCPHIFMAVTHVTQSGPFHLGFAWIPFAWFTSYFLHIMQLYLM